MYAEATAAAGMTVVTCADCAGLTFGLNSCRCTRGRQPVPLSTNGDRAVSRTRIVSELAAAVGATALFDISTGWCLLNDETILLSPEWRPDLPAERRDALVAAALAICCG